jgi:hypothetical protein
MATNSSYKTISKNAPKVKGSKGGSPTQVVGKFHNPGGVKTNANAPAKRSGSNLG